MPQPTPRVTGDAKSPILKRHRAVIGSINTWAFVPQRIDPQCGLLCHASLSDFRAFNYSSVHQSHLHTAIQFLLGLLYAKYVGKYLRFLLVGLYLMLYSSKNKWRV